LGAVQERRRLAARPDEPAEADRRAGRPRLQPVAVLVGGRKLHASPRRCRTPRGRFAWRSCSGAVPILTDLTSYYFSILLAFALLWRRIPVAGIVFTLTALASAITPAFVEAEDQRYAAISVAYVLFVFGITLAFALRARQQSRVPAAIIAIDRPGAPRQTV
jgi:hypothetical protein